MWCCAWFPFLASFCPRRAGSLLALSSSFRGPVKASLLSMEVTRACWPCSALAAVWSLIALGGSLICVNSFLLLCSSLFSVKGYAGIKVSVIFLCGRDFFVCSPFEKAFCWWSALCAFSSALNVLNLVRHSYNFRRVIFRFCAWYIWALCVISWLVVGFFPFAARYYFKIEFLLLACPHSP